MVRRAMSYVERYESQLGGTLSREHYLQRFASVQRPGQTARLVSDYLLIEVGPSEWLPFRDVLEVNGSSVHASDPGHLRELFGHGDAASLQQTAAKLTAENARYNIRWMGNIDMPLLAITFLTPANAPRFRYRLAKRELVDGTDAYRLDYQEFVHPTIIKLDTSGADDPASGSFWLREDGSILKTLLHTGGSADSVETVVTFCEAPALSMLVPCTMHQRSIFRTETITADATYTDFRRFRVTVDAGRH